MEGISNQNNQSNSNNKNTKELFAQVFKYGITGIALNASAYLVYIALTWHLLDPKLAVAILYPIGVLAGYLAHACYSFSYKSLDRASLFRFLIAHLIGFTENIALLYIFSDLLKFPHQLVQIAAILIVAGTLFLLFRYFVFKGQDVQP